MFLSRIALGSFRRFAILQSRLYLVNIITHNTSDKSTHDPLPKQHSKPSSTRTSHKHIRLQIDGLETVAHARMTRFELGFGVSHGCSMLSPPVAFAKAVIYLGGDPAAGSPTATLLRLFPPYETQIRRSQGRPRLTQESLGWNDGRCVQGAGTYSPRDSDARLLGIPCSRGWVSTLDPNYGRV